MRIRIAILALAALAAVAFARMPDGGPTEYNSGDASERITQLPVYLSQQLGGTVFYHVVYCVDLGTVPTGGTILQASGDVEITNDLSYWPLIGSQIALTDSCTNADESQITEITEGNGYNCLPTEHHCVLIKSGSLTVPAGNTKRFVVFIAHATGGSYWTLGDFVDVERDYGRLSVLRWD